MKLKISFFGLAILFGLVSTVAVKADEPMARVDSNISMPLVINGSPVGDLPSSAPQGARVCIESEFKYTAEGERYRFEGWRLDRYVKTSAITTEEQPIPNPLIPGECIQATQSSMYSAFEFVNKSPGMG